MNQLMYFFIERIHHLSLIYVFLSWKFIMVRQQPNKASLQIQPKAHKKKVDQDFFKLKGKFAELITIIWVKVISRNSVSLDPSTQTAN
jgi:hypothetical protein